MNFGAAMSESGFLIHSDADSARDCAHVYCPDTSQGL